MDLKDDIPSECIVWECDVPGKWKAFKVEILKVQREPWFSRDLGDMIKKKREVYNRYRQQGANKGPLMDIFKMSLAMGEVPEALTLSRCLRKAPKINQISRPVSLTSVVGKLLEGILRDRIFKFLDSHGLIEDSQHGFVRGNNVPLLLNLSALLYSSMVNWKSKFADYTKMGGVVDREEDFQSLQRDLDQLEEWANKWMMELIADKCEGMHLGRANQGRMYTVNGGALRSAEEQRDPGIQVHCALEVVLQATSLLPVRVWVSVSDQHRDAIHLSSDDFSLCPRTRALLPAPWLGAGTRRLPEDGSGCEAPDDGISPPRPSRGRPLARCPERRGLLPFWPQRSRSLLALWALLLHLPATSTMFSCSDIEDLHVARVKCVENNLTKMEDSNSTHVESLGCPDWWDNMTCWPRSEYGAVINRTCPSYLHHLFVHQTGVMYRTCTKDGWSKLTPPFTEACEFKNFSSHFDEKFSLIALRPVYTAGYATSLIALVIAVMIFAAFRKFHCTRNYIHMNLFISFILRSVSVFIKDEVLLPGHKIDYCSQSTVMCKCATAFFHYCILANVSWLLVEGLFLQALLSLTFVSHAKYFLCYCLIGWGLPGLELTIWIIMKQFVDNKGCWDKNQNKYTWWIIRGAILVSVLVNFVIFLNIIRILIQKLGSTNAGRISHNPFSRLTKSTLLLIPLLGIHYIVCVFLPDHVAEDLRFYIELGLGSFQGLVVGMLYCFLNTEVLTELKRQLRLCCPAQVLEFTKRRKHSTLAEGSLHTCNTQVTLLEKQSQMGKSIK
ncbi:vasoactive intestinal polypeptide receptor 1-like [Narcine bancroftii]|uniref:vasoactive intestinal polypeptide receptor 1-like n=1 Tax=Narcine bancroftii TaxID=1343680 RepID=UPI0038314E55